MTISTTASPLSTPASLTLDELKQALFQNIRYRLGDGIIDLELDPQHFEAAYNYAIKVYRQRAQNATAESYGARGYYMNFQLTNYNKNRVELFGVGSSLFKSYP